MKINLDNLTDNIIFEPEKYSMPSITLSNGKEYRFEEIDGKLHVSVINGKLAAISGAGVNVLDLEILELNA